MTTREEEITRQARLFDTNHPDFWQTFKRLAFRMINAGHKHYSVNGVFEAVRWETAINQGPDAEHFKINNNFRPYFARKFAVFFPLYADFFRTRKRISKDWPATNMPPLTPAHFENETGPGN